MDETTTTTTLIRTLTSPSLSSSSSSSSDHANVPLPTLPSDLIAEILCRLPVKLLVQLRCLCKFFNTLISDSKFAKKHLRMSTTTHHLILSTSKDESHLISYPLHSIFNSVTTINATHLYFPFKQQSYSIVASCDGILCLFVNRRSVILWNPSIRKFTKLPSLKSRIKIAYIAYGFGYDPLIDNYKVVAVFSYVGGDRIHEAKIKIHTLGANSWRMIEGNFPTPVGQSLKFVSGTLNWSLYTDDGYRVFSFDLVNESYRKLLPPNYGVEDVYDVILGVLRDCLCILAHSRTFSSVWLMKEYGNEESWTKLFSVSYNEDPFFYPCTRPIWLSGDDQLLMESRALLRHKLVIYRFKNDNFKFPMIQNINFRITPIVYVESLISPCF